MPSPNVFDRSTGLLAWLCRTAAVSSLLFGCEAQRTVTELGGPPTEDQILTVSVDLDGQQVHPPGQSTAASAHATLTFMRSTSGGIGGGSIELYKMHYDVTAQGIDGVTSVHIHGPSAPDTIGPILAILFESALGTGPVDGQLVSDSIPHRYGFDFDDDRLAGDASAGSILGMASQQLLYLDIHTLTRPDGEIRGNVR